jgi:hypothetical protein
MASIGEILAAALQRGKVAAPVPGPQIDEARPWETPMAASESMPMAGPPAAPPAEPYSYASPDPYAEAQRLAERQALVAKGAKPSQEVVGIPVHILDYLISKVRR